MNRVSVTVLDNWGNGGPEFTRTLPFDKLTAVLSKADYEAYKRGELAEAPPAPKLRKEEKPKEFDTLQKALQSGVKVLPTKRINRRFDELLGSIRQPNAQPTGPDSSALGPRLPAQDRASLPVGF